MLYWHVLGEGMFTPGGVITELAMVFRGEMFSFKVILATVHVSASLATQSAWYRSVKVLGEVKGGKLLAGLCCHASTPWTGHLTLSTINSFHSNFEFNLLFHSSVHLRHMNLKTVFGFTNSITILAMILRRKMFWLEMVFCVVFISANFAAQSAWNGPI